MVLLVGNVVLLAAFHALRGGGSYNSLFGLIANLSMLVPTLACFARAIVGGPRRAALRGQEQLRPTDRRRGRVEARAAFRRSARVAGSAYERPEQLDRERKERRCRALGTDL